MFDSSGGVSSLRMACRLFFVPMKYRFYEFSPVIYPRKLWIVRGGTLKDIKSLFLTRKGGEIEIGDDGISTMRAWTCNVERKSDRKYGVVMWFPHDMAVHIIAHEATHAALYICGEIGMTFDSDDNEQLAYLLQWVVRCADAVRLGKVKPLELEDITKKN